MSYYSTCAVCGAHLDPSERCTCADADENVKKNSKTAKTAFEVVLEGDTKDNADCCL